MQNEITLISLNLRHMLRGQAGVLDEASRQLEYEERVRRDFVNALIYPIFLVCSGGASIGFLFYVVVPKFSEMLSNANAHLSGLSAFVIADTAVGHQSQKQRHSTRRRP